MKIFSSSIWRRFWFTFLSGIAGGLAATAVAQTDTPTPPPPVNEAPANAPHTGLSTTVTLSSPGIHDILKMLDAKVDAGVIMAYIRNSPIAYNPSASEIIALKERGVPDEILTGLMQRGSEVRTQMAQTTQTEQPAQSTAPLTPPEGGAPYAYPPQYDGSDFAGYGYPDYSPYFSYAGYPYWYWSNYWYPWSWAFYWPFSFGFHAFHFHFHFHDHGNKDGHSFAHGHSGSWGASHGTWASNNHGSWGANNHGSWASNNHATSTANRSAWTPVRSSGLAYRSASAGRSFNSFARPSMGSMSAMNRSFGGAARPAGFGMRAGGFAGGHAGGFGGGHGGGGGGHR